MNIVTTIENWLKRLIASEVSKLDTSLRSERAAFDTQVQSFKVQFDEVLQRLIDISEHSQQNIQLRATLNTTREQFTSLQDTLRKLHPGKF